jgi:hypothetical protein
MEPKVSNIGFEVESPAIFARVLAKISGLFFFHSASIAQNISKGKKIS